MSSIDIIRGDDTGRRRVDVFILDGTTENDIVDIDVSMKDDFSASSLATCRVTSMFPDGFQTF